MELYADECLMPFPVHDIDLDLDVPRPLQIIKCVDRNQDLRQASRMTSSSSRYSAGTDESLGSAPEPPGGDQPLFIPKKRRQPVPWTTPGQQAQYQDRPADATPDKTPSSDGDLETTPKPRRSNSCTSPERTTEYLPPPTLSTKASLLFLKGRKPLGKPLNQDNLGTHMAHLSPGPAAVSPSPLDGWRLSSSATSSRISSSNFDISEPEVAIATTGPYLLAPKITVTPECKAIDDEVTTL
jgi:hypothetical protein